MTVFRFALIRSLRNGYNMILLIVLPLFIVFWQPDDWSSLPAGYRYYGIFLFFAAGKLVHLLLVDRMSGIVLRLSASPLTHFQYLLQNLLAYAILLLVQTATIAVCIIPIHGKSLPYSASLFLLFATFSFAAIGFSLAWSSHFRNKETSLSVMGGVIMLLSMLGGLLWPVEIMPESIQRAAMLVPTYWLAEGLRSVAAEAPLIDALFPSGILLLFTLAFLLIGSKRRLV